MKCTNRAIQAAICLTKCSCQCSCLGPDQDGKNNAFQRHFRCFLSLLQAESCRSLQDWRPGADFGICSSKKRPWVSLVLKWENAKWFPPIMKKDLGFLIRTAKKSSSLNDQNRMFSKGMSWHHPACCQLVAREWKIWWSVEIDLPAKTNLPASTSYNDVWGRLSSFRKYQLSACAGNWPAPTLLELPKTFTCGGTVLDP